jgi:hypothetical protein
MNSPEDPPFTSLSELEGSLLNYREILALLRLQQAGGNTLSEATITDFRERLESDLQFYLDFDKHGQAIPDIQDALKIVENLELPEN